MGGVSREPVRVTMRSDAVRRRVRNAVIAAVVVAAIAVVSVFVMRQRSESSKRADRLAAAAGCTPVRVVKIPVNGHLRPGERVTYSTSPPAGGPHNPVPLGAGVRSEALSDDPAAEENIYRAVHSLEHGYVIVWHDDLPQAARQALEDSLAKDRKVIVVPYPDLDGPAIAMTAWGRLQSCDNAELQPVRTFIARYREKTAPENAAQ